MIDSYAFGQVVVDGVAYGSDVIIFPDRVQADWWRREGHRLDLEDLETVLDYGPDVLVVGTGSSGDMDVPASTVEALASRGISVVSARTEEACQRFNAFLAEGKRVVAALHLTC